MTAIRRWIFPILLAGAAMPIAWAQEDSRAPEVESAPPEAPAAAAIPVDDQVKALRASLEGTVGLQRFRILDQIRAVYQRSGRVPDALKAKDEIVEDKLIAAGRRSLAASDLALSQALLHEPARSQRLIARAKQLASEARDDEFATLPREPGYAFLTAEAEIARRFQGRHDIAVGKTRERSDLAWKNLNNPALSDGRRSAAAAEFLGNASFHTILLVQNNRRQEALSYVNEMTWHVANHADLKRAVTPRHRARLEAARAVALTAQDDYDGALHAINAALEIYQRGDFGEADADRGIAYRLRLLIALSLGRIGDFQADVRAMQRARGLNPVLAGTFPESESESLALAAAGRWADAASRMNLQLDRDQRRLGTDSPFFKYRQAIYMLYLLQDPSAELSLGKVERFIVPLASTDDEWADSSYRGSYVEDAALTASMDRLMHAGDPASTSKAHALAFRIAELFRVNASQGALLDGAARLAARDPRLRALVEQEQILRFEQANNRQAFAVMDARVERIEKQPERDEAVYKRQLEARAERDKALQASNARLVQLRREISRQFPVYRELISPSIPDSTKLGAVLRPDEAYVNFYPGNRQTYAFVVRADGSLHAQRLEVSRDQLRRWVSSLRRGFDAGAPPRRPGDAGGFDLEAAHALHRALIGPLQPRLEGARTVYLSNSGVLSALPWNVLISAPATVVTEADWWISRIAPVQMPSASALLLARSQRVPGGKRASGAFAAYADPSFDGTESSAAIERDAVRGKVRARAVGGSLATLGMPDYRTVVPLPETAIEARAIAASLGADERSIVRGAQATRSRVLNDNLSDARVVAFATHGLMAGELPALRRAGLALSYEGTGWPDSLLTIDDIIGLRLNADWVVLSACNTGYASGQAGDSMSALSRGFFAAGGRSLLATQWAVESESATMLTVRTFEAFAKDDALSKADAITLSQREMLAGKMGDLYRHPYFWGGYFLAGDGAR